MTQDDTPFTLQQNERGEVVLIIEGEPINLGDLQAACEVMADFLAGVDFGD